MKITTITYALEQRLNKSAQIAEDFRQLLPSEQFDLVLKLYDLLSDFHQMELSDQLQEIRVLNDEEDEE